MNGQRTISEADDVDDGTLPDAYCVPCGWSGDRGQPCDCPDSPPPYSSPRPT